MKFKQIQFIIFSVIEFGRRAARVDVNLKRFKADHPFYFVLKSANNEIIFNGRYIK